MNQTPRRYLCDWCETPLAGKRSDALTCSKSCRQARWRAHILATAQDRATHPLRFCYADPPYPGNAHLYKGHPHYAGEVDLKPLLSQIDLYDGWALSTSAAALHAILVLLTSMGITHRIAIWIKRPRPHKTAHILNGWEPLLYHPMRGSVAARATHDTSSRPGAARQDQVIDTLWTKRPRRRPTLPTACLGMKPPEFCVWMFKLIGARPGDHFDDLFPGSGIVQRTWIDYTSKEKGPEPPSPIRPGQSKEAQPCRT